MNYKFNLDEWLAKFPLETRDSTESGYQASMAITSPWDICNNEQLRRELKDQIDWGTPVPMDIFIMADGEPKNRWVTKLGGLPYRPARLPWPTDESGEPLHFIAQFDFTNSIDLTGKLPGDVLLIFGLGQDVDEHPPYFEWYPLGLGNLVEASAIPYKFQFSPCFGHVFRAVNFPQAQESPTLKGTPKVRGKEVRYYEDLFLYRATQIGPGLIDKGSDRDLIGRHLCTIAGADPRLEKPYPFINRPTPLPFSWKMESILTPGKKYLQIGDLGGIHISIDQETELHATFTYS